MSDLRSPPIFLDFVEQHFEELDFLWEQRDSVVFAPDWTPGELAELEARAEAHLDGLRLAETHAIDVCRAALHGDEVYAALAACLVHMRFDSEPLRTDVVAGLAGASSAARDGIRRGLRHARIDDVADTLVELAQGGQVSIAAAAMDVLAFHRRPGGDPLSLLDSDDATDRALAFGVLMRRRELRDAALFQRGLADADSAVRRAALTAAAASSLPFLEQLCWTSVERTETGAAEALAFVGVVGSPSTAGRLLDALRETELVASACAALGALGASETVPALIDLTASESEAARVAADAFSRITGDVDVDRAADEPESQAGPAEGDTPPDLESDDEAEPVPDAALMANWWAENEDRFDPAGRFQAGIETTLVVGTPLLDTLPLQSRRDCFLAACAAGDPTPPDIELEALRP